MNTNGDAENAAVLAAARRTGPASTRASSPSSSRADLPDRVDAVVHRLRERRVARGGPGDAAHDARRAAHAGAPTASRSSRSAPGWELLSWGIEQRRRLDHRGTRHPAGRAVPRDGRVTGDLVVASPRFGLLVGFENHARDYVGAEGSPLGRSARAVGNGRGSGQEGVVMGAVIGTHLHGPVLAKNPGFADHLLASMAERAGLDYAPGPASAIADGYAAAAREAQLGPSAPRHPSPSLTPPRARTTAAQTHERPRPRPGRSSCWSVGQSRPSTRSRLDSSCQLCAICDSFSWCLRPWWAQNRSSPLATTTRM